MTFSSLVIRKRFPERVYYDTRLCCWPASSQCEHCDGSDSSMVRVDYLRGRVCPPCDDVLDDMLSDSEESP